MVGSAPSLRHDPRYGALLDRLESLARQQLGAGAAVERDPVVAGRAVVGVIATLGSRRVSYTLPALARRALRELGEEVAGAWD